MNNQLNNFKETIKVDVNNSTSIINDLIKKLDLYNLPSNIKVKMDNKYLKIKIAEDCPDWDEFSDLNEKINSHLTFKIPLIEDDLSYYFNSPLLQELSNRYELYSTDYKDKIIEYSDMERKVLQRQFPNMVFKMEVRMKSKGSYEEKENKKIRNNESPYIDDIIAEKIIISEFDSSKDPHILETACYTVSKALYDFRINTNFRMKKVTVKDGDGKTDIPFLTKDFIANPKPVINYQCLHIRVYDETNPDCSYETQIKTFDMEFRDSKKGDELHKKYKPRLLNDLSLFRVPKYSEITNFSDENGNPVILNVPTKSAFFHFYNVPLEKYRNELSYIEKFIPFKELRKKLHQLNLDKNVNPLESELQK